MFGLNIIEGAHGSWKLWILHSYSFFGLAICFLFGKNDINIDKIDIYF